MKLRFIITYHRCFLVCILWFLVSAIAGAEYSRAEETPAFPLVPEHASNVALTAEIQARKDRIKTFFEFIEKGDLPAIKTALTAHPDLMTSRDYYGWSPLQSAMSSRKTDVVKLLLDLGADFKNALPSGEFALGYAISAGDLELARLLIEKGAPVNAPPRTHYSPFQRAIEKDNSEFLKLLLASGADLQATDSKGRTPMHWMIADGYGGLDAIKMLADKGADLNARDDEGQTPIFRIGFKTPTGNSSGSYYAAQGKYYQDAVAYLVSKGADINARSRDGNTPLHEAARGGYSNRIADLLQAGADPNARNSRGDLPLHLILQSGLGLDPPTLKNPSRKKRFKCARRSGTNSAYPRLTATPASDA